MQFENIYLLVGKFSSFKFIAMTDLGDLCSIIMFYIPISDIIGYIYV